MGLLGEVGPVAQLHEMTQMVLEGINEARQADRQANCVEFGCRCVGEEYWGR